MANSSLSYLVVFEALEGIRAKESLDSFFKMKNLNNFESLACDSTAAALTDSDIKQRLEKPNILVAILTPNLLNNPSALVTLETAQENSKPIILVHDQESFPFPSYENQPPKLRPVFESKAVPYVSTYETTFFQLFEQTSSQVEKNLQSRGHTEDTTTDAFLSHKRSTGQAIAARLYGGLFKHHKIFLDSYAQFQLHNLEEIVTRTKLFVFILTPGVFESKWCQTELETAINLNKPILVVRDSLFPHPQSFPESYPEKLKEFLLNAEKLVFSPEFADDLIASIANRIRMEKLSNVQKRLQQIDESLSSAKISQSADSLEIFEAEEKKFEKISSSLIEHLRKQRLNLIEASRQGHKQESSIELNNRIEQTFSIVHAVIESFSILLEKGAPCVSYNQQFGKLVPKITKMLKSLTDVIFAWFQGSKTEWETFNQLQQFNDIPHLLQKLHNHIQAAKIFISRPAEAVYDFFILHSASQVEGSKALQFGTFADLNPALKIGTSSELGTSDLNEALLKTHYLVWIFSDKISKSEKESLAKIADQKKPLVVLNPNGWDTPEVKDKHIEHLLNNQETTLVLDFKDYHQLEWRDTFNRRLLNFFLKQKPTIGNYDVFLSYHPIHDFELAAAVKGYLTEENPFLRIADPQEFLEGNNLIKSEDLLHNSEYFILISSDKYKIQSYPPIKKDIEAALQAKKPMEWIGTQFPKDLIHETDAAWKAICQCRMLYLHPIDRKLCMASVQKLFQRWNLLKNISKYTEESKKKSFP